MFNLLNLLDLVFMYDTSVYHTLCLKFIFVIKYQLHEVIDTSDV